MSIGLIRLLEVVKYAVMTEQKKSAISLDLDGVVFKRPPFQMAFFKYLLLGSRIYKEFTLPKSVDRAVVDSRSSKRGSEMARKRKIKEGVKEFIEKKFRQSDIYVNTGRHVKRAWVEMTKDRLKEEGIAGFVSDIFFAPEKMKSKVSKALAIKQLIDMGYKDITHYDDNPEDVLPLAKMFPQVNFVIVQDLSTGILFSRKEAEKYKNVRRIASFKTEIAK